MPSDHLAPSDHGSAHPASDRAKALVRMALRAAGDMACFEGVGNVKEEAHRLDRALLDYIAELEQRASGGSA
jgi:hypothetical protein